MQPIKPVLTFILLFICFTSLAQQGNPGIIAGNLLDESTLLRTAYAYEQATDWHKRRPQMGGAASQT